MKLLAKTEHPKTKSKSRFGRFSSMEIRKKRSELMEFLSRTPIKFSEKREVEKEEEKEVKFLVNSS
jgi:hypothetical protein